MPPVSNLKIEPPPGDKLYLRLRLITPSPSKTLLIDDVDLWESQTGACDERH